VDHSNWANVVEDGTQCRGEELRADNILFRRRSFPRIKVHIELARKFLKVKLCCLAMEIAIENQRKFRTLDLLARGGRIDGECFSAVENNIVGEG